jgi:hypothetical protein
VDGDGGDSGDGFIAGGDGGDDGSEGDGLETGGAGLFVG